MNLDESSLRETVVRQEPRGPFVVQCLAQLMVVGILIGTLMFRDTELSMALRTMFVALLLLFVNRVGSVVLFAAFETSLFLSESRQEPVFQFGSCLFVAISLGLLMFLDSDRKLRRFFKMGLREIAYGLFDWDFQKAADESSRLQDGPTQKQSRPPTKAELDAPFWFLRPMLTLSICVLIAQFLLVQVPLLREVSSRERDSITMEESLKNLPFLVTGMLGIVVVATSFWWKRMTPEQASVYMRSTLANLQYHELRLIVRSRMKARRRRQQMLADMIEMDDDDVAPRESSTSVLRSVRGVGVEQSRRP